MTYEQWKRLPHGPPEQPKGIALTQFGGWRMATDAEICVIHEGRDAWLAGEERPDANAFKRSDRQSLYEDAYYGEIRDRDSAVRALIAEDKRRGVRR